MRRPRCALLHWTRALAAIAAIVTVVPAAAVASRATPRTMEPQAAPPDRRAVPDGPFDRARTLERMLEPASAATMQAAATVSKDAKTRSEAAAAYDRGFVLYEQGAFAEAEREFRNAEKKDGDNLETVLAMGWLYDKVHKPDDAIKRFEKIYKKDPRNLRALAGMAASYEERQQYGEAVKIWQRYVRAELSDAERREGQALLAGAQELFVARYEIAENPGGGAANTLTREQELQLGQQAAQQATQDFAQSGIEPLKDEVVVTYVMNLCAYLVSNAKNFPSNYQVFVIDTADVNAFTIPGFIFVNRGLLAAVGSESELAGVIAHEIGHVVAHHSAKKVTKQVTDQQQAEQWRNSNSKFLRWLGSTSGSAYGQAAFSREAEAQADRLAVHITYDSGIDPHGFASFFQKLESIAPSSRKSWDLMARSHPFSIDRLNTIDAYIDLLPRRPLRKSSPEFTAMAARLSSLPAPADVTGMQRPALEPPRATPPAVPGAPGGATQPFTMDSVPFAGEVPAGWGGRKTPAGTFIFEGPKGTESYEVSIELGLEPKRAGLTIDQLGQAAVDSLSRKAQAQVQAPASETANDGTPVRLIKATYGLPGQSGNLVTIRHLTVVLDYPGYYAILSYFTPDAIYQKYTEAFTLFLQKFRYTGK